MVILLYLVAFGIIILILILVSRIHVSFNLNQLDNIQTVTICIYFYGIRLYKKGIHLSSSSSLKWPDLLKEDIYKGIKKIEHEVRTFFKTGKKIKNLLIALLLRSKCNKFTWCTYIGTGKADTTGMVIGSVWTVKGIVVGLISKQCDMNCKPKTTIVPHFQHRHFNMEFTCMFSIKIGQTIYIILKELKK